jgi:hypothetical protein
MQKDLSNLSKEEFVQVIRKFKGEILGKVELLVRDLGAKHVWLAIDKKDLVAAIESRIEAIAWNAYILGDTMFLGEKQQREVIKANEFWDKMDINDYKGKPVK